MTCRRKSMREGWQCDGPLLCISRAQSNDRVTAQPVEEESVPAVQWRISYLPTCTPQAKKAHGDATRLIEDPVECESLDGISLQQLRQVDGIAANNAALSGGYTGLPQHYDRWCSEMTGACTSTALAGSTKDNHTYVGGALSTDDASLLPTVDACSLSTAITARTYSNDAEQDSSRASTATPRLRTEAVGAALRQMESPLVDRQSGSKVPHIDVCGGEEGYITVGTVAVLLATRPPQDGAPRDRKDWIATPHLVSPRLTTKQRPIRPRDTRRHLDDHDNKVLKGQFRFGANRCSGNNNDGALEFRVASQIPAPPPRRSHTPRPICAILRNRTLKVARQDPCIFRRELQCESQRTVHVASTTRQLKSWHIVNRRIFGFREVPRRGSIVRPEWMVFGGGIPPQGLHEKKRWMLRLGRISAETKMS